MKAGVLMLGILAAGFVFGFLARLIVPVRNRLTTAETALVGIAGSGAGAIAMNVSIPNTSATDFRWWTLLGMLAGAVLVYLIASYARNRRGHAQRPDPPTLEDLAAGGESHRLEVKQTARWNVHTSGRDPAVELAIAKAVAGFLNADGGTLVIGVDDSGNPTGLDRDLRLMKEQDLDRFQLWLIDHLERCLGKPALANIRVGFEPIGGIEVCRVDVSPSPEAVFLDEPGQGREADMYVRMGNSTRKLLTDEAIVYTRHHWKTTRRRRSHRREPATTR